MNYAALSFLVVDSVSAMCQVTANKLRALGARDVQTAANGEEAFNLLKSGHVDVVLSDWAMPVMDGLALLQAMRASETLAKTPLVLVTAEIDREKITQAIGLGVSNFLVKPYTTARLEEKIASALGKLAPTPAASAAAPMPAKADARQPTLLVVDDVPENLRLIADLFEGRYKVKVAANGTKALAMCTADNPPDLVLLDVMMPGMDGFEVARRLRAHPNSEHIPVIFVTALNDDASQKKGLDLGAVDFVSKPVDPAILLLRVDNFMRYMSLHMQRQAEYDTLLDNARLREDVERMLRHDLLRPLESMAGDAEALLKALGESHPQAAQARKLAQGAREAIDAYSARLLAQAPAAADQSGAPAAAPPTNLPGA
jgi:two-component system sensor histidine kinase/response regulator